MVSCKFSLKPIHWDMTWSWLVVDLPLWKIMEWKSDGMIQHSHILWKIKFMFQTTNQDIFMCWDFHHQKMIFLTQIWIWMCHDVSWCVMVCMKMDENGRYHGITIKSPVVVAHIIQAKPCQSWNHVWWSGYLSLRKNFGKVGLKRVSFWIVPSMNDPLWIGRKRILHKSAPRNKMYSKSEKSVKASKWSSISVQSSSIFMDNSDNSSILVRIGPILACCIEIHPQPQHTTAPTRLDHRLWIGSALPH